LEDAIEAYEKAVSLEPDHADVYYNMGRLHWLRRDFVRAFELMEWRWKKKQGLIGIKLSSNKPAWSGDVKSEVFVWKEQGIGDEIMFSSILLDADRKSKKLIVECDKRLIPLYRRSFPKRIKFIGDRKIISESEYESQIAIGSLPLAFRRELRDFSDASSGWLKADTRKVKGLRKKLEAKPNEKVIGITWFTNASDPRSKRRNIPVDLFSKYLTQIPAKYVNLQYGETVEDLSKMRSKFALDVSQVDSLDLFNDLDGLAALISACDIVISIDNATVHLAGALGVDTRVLLPFAPDDRWGINQKDSYWYDSLTLYRQETQGDWSNPLKDLEHDLTTSPS
jgi:tetratricopeptide (TPR) repeat protein